MSSLSDNLPLINKMASNLTASEMLAAVIAAADDPEQHSKWRTVVQQVSQNSTPRLQAIFLLTTSNDYGIPVQELESIMDAAIARKQDVGSHISDCVDRLVGICEENGVTVTDEMRDGFRTATAALAEQVNKTRSPASQEQPGRWADRTRQQQGGDLPPFG